MNTSTRDLLQSRVMAAIRSAAKVELRNRQAPREMDAVLRLALAKPTARTELLLRLVEQELGWRVEINVMKFLQKHWIFNHEERVLASDRLSRLHQHFTVLLHERDESALRKAHEEILRWLSDKINYRVAHIASRRVLIMTAIDLRSSDEAQDRLLADAVFELMSHMLMSHTAIFFRSLVQDIAKHYGIDARNSIDDRVSQMIQQVQHETQLQTNDPASDVETLAEQNADLRAALFGLQHELESLQEQIRALRSTSADDATARFLADLNAGAAGHLLDNIVFSSRAIRELESTGWIPEPIEIEGIVATVTMLADHLARLGVQPIYEVGEMSQIAMEDLSEIQYVGSEFSSPTELKVVRFKSPGWRYRDQRIARAQAVEIASGSSAHPM